MWQLLRNLSGCLKKETKEDVHQLKINSFKNAIRTGFEILNRARLIVLENVLCINSCNFLRRIKIGGTTKDQYVMFLCD